MSLTWFRPLLLAALAALPADSQPKSQPKQGATASGVFVCRGGKSMAKARLFMGEVVRDEEVLFAKIKLTASLPTALTDDQGRFQLTCKGQPGACACENRVIIAEPDLPPHLRSESAQAALARHFQSLGGRPLPPKYANLADSPLIAHVTSDQREYKFELTR